MRCNNILEAVGGTPLVRLNRINQGLKPQIYVKADYINPGGSVKDRIGISMIDDATNNPRKKSICSKLSAPKSSSAPPPSSPTTRAATIPWLKNLRAKFRTPFIPISTTIP